MTVRVSPSVKFLAIHRKGVAFFGKNIDKIFVPRIGNPGEVLSLADQLSVHPVTKVDDQQPAQGGTHTQGHQEDGILVDNLNYHGYDGHADDALEEVDGKHAGFIAPVEHLDLEIEYQVLKDSCEKYYDG